MTCEELFTEYGSPCEYSNGRIYMCLYRPDKLRTTESVISADADAKRKIEELQRYIEALTDYRQKVAARYGELLTMNYTTELKLTRERRDSVWYYLTVTVKYEDGTEDLKSSKRYSGKDRAAAIADFETQAKQHPDYIAVKDIAKRSWEK